MMNGCLENKAYKKRFFNEKLIAILRGVDQERLPATVDALKKGGITLVEIPFDQTKTPEYTTEKIKTVLTNFSRENVLCGAGTVLSPEQVQAAYDAGSSFIITPSAKQDVIRCGKELGLFVMAGAMSPTEIENAYEWGADVIKIFPADVLGVSYIKALRGPFPYIPLAAVGGVDLDNISRFCDAGISMFGIGGNLVRKDMICGGDYDRMAELAGKYVERIRAYCK